MTPAAKLHRAARRLRIELARQDPNSLIEYTLRDERSGQPIRQALLHRKWQQIISDNPMVVILAAVGHGKSAQITVGRVLHELIRDPRLRVLVVSRTEHQAARFIKLIGTILTRSRSLAEVAPLLRVVSWDATSITLERPTHAKDPSIQAIGMGSNPTGNRSDLVVLDDCLSWTSTREQSARDKTESWISSEILTRLPPGGGGRVIVAGVVWHPDDLLHRLIARGWPAFRFPAERADGTPQWDRWTPDALDEMRRRIGPLESACMLDLVPRSDADSVFLQSWIDVALARGAGKQPVPGLTVLGLPTFTGVDLAVTAKSTSDKTALATIRVHRDGTRELLWVESGRWAGPQIEEKIFAAHQRFGSTIIVESVAAQQYLIDYTRQHSAVPIIAFQTRAGEMSLPWQANRFATELANGKWSIPSASGRANHPEIAALLKEILYYDPAAHCGDRLAACLFARWGAENVGRQQAGFFTLDLLRR